MPLILLAGALKAVEAIQQGCELYKEYKGVVLKAKETFDEAKEHVEEVVGLWQFIKSKLFPSKEPDKSRSDVKPVVQEITTVATKKPPPKRASPVQHSEQEIKADLIKNLKIFFKAMIAINKKIDEQKLRIDTQFIEPDELLDVSLDLVIAKKEMEKAQKELRETMVYQSPPELGSLYTDVIEMFGIVQEKQEITQLLTIKRRKEEWQRKNNLLSKIRQRIAWVIVVALIVLEIWAIIIAVVLARQPT
jgi:hypothetical protein